MLPMLYIYAIHDRFFSIILQQVIQNTFLHLVGSLGILKENFYVQILII
jgi:hypothetical protein